MSDYSEPTPQRVGIIRRPCMNCPEAQDYIEAINAVESFRVESWVRAFGDEDAASRPWLREYVDHLIDVASEGRRPAPPACWPCSEYGR